MTENATFILKYSNVLVLSVFDTVRRILLESWDQGSLRVDLVYELLNGDSLGTAEKGTLTSFKFYKLLLF